ncbi:hypothetical protein NIES4103_16940 [Nostoc sp. NIES-4103]|nr:hypothetical protein NIES4103_16940 [Nostoc sp. NIES-4103]
MRYLTKAKNSENNDGKYSDLLDILREKQKIRLGNFKSGEYITLEYNFEETSLQSEKYPNISSSSNPIDDVLSEPNANPQPELNVETSISNNKIDNIARNSSLQSTNKNRTDADNKELNESPRVFISYRHDSEEHKRRVLRFHNGLQTQGVECIIDLSFNKPPKEGWIRWMRTQIQKAKFVIVVCTEEYKNSVENRKGGVGWEGAIIEQALYEDYEVEKFISIIFSKNFTGQRQELYRKYVPDFLRQGNIFIFDIDKMDKNGYKLPPQENRDKFHEKNSQLYDEEYQRLYAQLTSQDLYKIEPLGSIIKLELLN